MVGCWCKDPSSHFHCASRFNHPRTRTHVRLLGPCFKTGRREPFRHQAVHSRVHPGTFTHPEASFQVPGVFLKCEPKLTHKARSTTRVLLKTYCHACAEAAGNRISTQQSRQDALVPFASLSAISGTFNSLFKVLFTFPSWYLFAIVLEPIFCFR